MHQRREQRQTLPLLCAHFALLVLFYFLTRFVAQFNYKQEDIVMLTDDAQNPRQIPNKQNIVSHDRLRTARHIAKVSAWVPDPGDAMACSRCSAERFALLPL